MERILIMLSTLAAIFTGLYALAKYFNSDKEK